MIEAIAQEAARRNAEPMPDNGEWFRVACERLRNAHDFGSPESLQGVFAPVVEYLYTIGDFNSALNLIDHGAGIAAKNGWESASRYFHHTMAVMLKSVGDTGRAVSHLAKALEIARTIGDARGEALAWGQLASTVLDIGKHEEVIQYARTGLAIAASCGNNAATIRAVCNQLVAEASLHLLIEPRDQKRRLAEGLVTIKNAEREIGTPNTTFAKIQLAKFYLTETQLQVRAGHVHEAQVAAANCRAMAEQSGNPLTLIHANIAEAMVEAAEGKFELATQSCDRMLTEHSRREEIRGDLIAAMAYVQECAGDKNGASKSRVELYQTWQRRQIASTFRVLDHVTRQFPVDESQLLNAATLEAIETIATIGELHDDDTGTHVYRVGALAALIAARLGWEPGAAKQLDFAARLHDIGKIAIHADIMLKPGALSAIERAEMEKHASIGATILSRVAHPVMALAAQVAGGHHERWDGTGYPLGLAGEQIPIAARITAVADVYDALTHARCYKVAWSPADAIQEISRNRGVAFDPAIVDAFMAVMTRLLSELGPEGVEKQLSAAAEENNFNVARQFLTRQVMRRR